jgi:molybdate transport system substrate-binding protein
MSRALAATVLAFVLTGPVAADAAEITVWTARAIATVLAETGPLFERATGQTPEVSSDLPSTFERRARAGQPVDLLITGSSPLDQWIKAGRIIAETRTDIAHSGIGVAVRAGARKPDIATTEAFVSSSPDRWPFP